MATEEIYVNPQARRQATASKDKPRKASASMKGADDPDYENITLTVRNQGQPKGSHSPPKSEAPSWSRPSSDPAWAPPWLHTVIMSLHILLTLLSIVLLAWVLANNSVMSQELLVLKMELQNVSILLHECQEEQRQGWSGIYPMVTNSKVGIDTIKSKVQEGNKELKVLSSGIKQIKTEIQKILEMLQKMPNQPSTHQ